MADRMHLERLREIVNINLQCAVTQAIAFEQANDNDPEIIAKFMALDQAGPEIAAALSQLAGYIETFGGVDNGYCRECGRHRKYADGYPEQCSNPNCLSNRAPTPTWDDSIPIYDTPTPAPTDRERVDWLERNALAYGQDHYRKLETVDIPNGAGTGRPAIDFTKRFRMWNGVAPGFTDYRSLRQAIDAAMHSTPASETSE